MPEFFIDPVAFPLVPAGYSIEGDLCLSKCFAPGEMAINPMNKEIGFNKIQPSCAIYPKKNKKGRRQNFGVCPSYFYTDGFAPWAPISISGSYPQAYSVKAVARKLLKKLYGIMSYEEAKEYVKKKELEEQVLRAIMQYARQAFR